MAYYHRSGTRLEKVLIRQRHIRVVIEMSNHWEEDRRARGWRKVATGTWLYDRTVPTIAIWAKPAPSHTRATTKTIS